MGDSRKGERQVTANSPERTNFVTSTFMEVRFGETRAPMLASWSTVSSILYSGFVQLTPPLGVDLALAKKRFHFRAGAKCVPPNSAAKAAAVVGLVKYQRR